MKKKILSMAKQKHTRTVPHTYKIKIRIHIRKKGPQGNKNKKK